MGIVIGETAEIGDDVTLYQGVTLGGTSLQRVKRHPTLLDGVVVGAGAIILGAVTVGEKARIGAGAVVVRDVPAGATVVGLAGRVIDHGAAPHPAMDLAESKGDHAVAVLEVLIDRVAELEGRVNGSKSPARRRRPTTRRLGDLSPGGAPRGPRRVSYPNGGPAGPRRATAFHTVS